ncbi:MAG TPA: hypothetical protein VIG68_06765 [Lysobacter sp.]
MIKRASIAAAAALLVSASAFAAVTFDPATGTGFVGKGDVQLAFGWNNATLQRNAGKVTFTYATEATYAVTCEWNTYTNGNKNREAKTVPHKVTEGLSVASRANFDSSARSNKQGDVTGFQLLGFTSIAPSGGTVPAVGDMTYCNANGMGPLANPNTDSHDGSVVTAVGLVEGSEATGVFANFGDQSIQLPY